MKNILYGIVIFAGLRAYAVEYHNKVDAYPTFQGHNIYVGGGPELPDGLHTLLADAACIAMGFESSADTKIEMLKVEKPLVVGMPEYADADHIILSLVTLDPHDNPTVAVLTQLSCYMN